MKRKRRPDPHRLRVFRRVFFKVLDETRTGRSGWQWPAPGVDCPPILPRELSICQHGYHVADVDNLLRWTSHSGSGPTHIWLVKTSGRGRMYDEKYVFGRAKLVRLLGVMTNAAFYKLSERFWDWRNLPRTKREQRTLRFLRTHCKPPKEEKP